MVFDLLRGWIKRAGLILFKQKLIEKLAGKANDWQEIYRLKPVPIACGSANNYGRT